MQSGLAAAMAVRGTGAPTMTWARLIGQHKPGLWIATLTGLRCRRLDHVRRPVR
jgi:hypothetical protein